MSDNDASVRRSNRPWTGESGAFDLTSVVVGGLAVAILIVGVLAITIGVIPWSQDEQAKHNLAAVRTAEGVSRSQDGAFVDGVRLQEKAYLAKGPERLTVTAGGNGSCYLAVGRSDTGKYFYTTQDMSQARAMTPSTPAGCLTPQSIQGIVDGHGGWGQDVYTAIGGGSGTGSDPGRGVVSAGADGSSSTVDVASLEVLDRTVRIRLSNTSATPVTASYTLDVTCADLTSGTVTVASIDGTLDLNGAIIAATDIQACSPGTKPISVSVHSPYAGTAAAGTAPIRQQAIWRVSYVYYQATPVVRGSVVSGPMCIDDKDLGSADGNPILLAACNGSDAQRWQWDGSSAIRQGALTNKCLSTANPASTGPQTVVLAACSGQPAQNFVLTSLTAGKAQIVQASSGLCLDIQGGTQTAGAPLVTAACNGSLSQTWQLPSGSASLVPGTVPNATVPTTAGGPVLGPSTPTGVSFAGYNGSGVHLNWTSVSGATGYLLEVTGTSTTYGADRKATTTAVNMSAVISGGSTATGGIMIPAGTDGTITVRAMQGSATSAPSQGFPFSTPENSVIAVASAQGGTDFTFGKAVMNTVVNGTTSDVLSTPRGTALASPNGRYFAVLQADNNFVIYDKSTNKATYSSNTYSSSATRLTFQPDANLVFYTSSNSPVKATGTSGISKPAILTMQNDGNLVIYDAGGVARWASMTSGGFMVKR